MATQPITSDVKEPQKMDLEASAAAGDKLAIYDAQIGEVADLETDHQAHVGIDTELTPEEKEKERRLLRKIDLHLMPLLMITYGIQYSDKISLSSGVAFDLKQDAHLVGNDYAWLSTGFYLAYLCAELPFGWVMQRYPMEKVLGLTVLGWGICVLCMAACNNFTQLMAIRTLLGILEAPISPGFLIMVTAWYKREEQMMRSMAFFAMNSFFSLFILMINYGIGAAAVGSKIASWRAINLFLGSLSFIWGCILIWLLCVPKNAKWLTPEEKTLAYARLVRNQAGESSSGVKFKWTQAFECARDPQIFFIAAFTILSCAAAGGYSTFSTIILQSFGLDVEQTISYQLPWYTIQFVGISTMAYIINKYPTRNLNLIIVMTMIIPAFTGILLEALLSNTHRWGRLIGFWMTGVMTPASFVIWATTGLNIAGRTKKSCAQAIVFIAWCAGFCIGPQTFYASSAPDYRPGLYFCCACFGSMGLVLMSWYVWVRWENNRRDKNAIALGMSAAQQRLEGCLYGLQDRTDIENQHFRYHY